MDLNAVQHDKMHGILEKITWIIEVVRGEKIEARQAGFAIDDHLIMSTANLFRHLKKKREIKGRTLQNQKERVDLEQVFMMERWDVIIFQLPDTVRCNQVGKFVRDGRLSEKQILLHMGHWLLGAYHVGRVISPCVQDVKLPPVDYYTWTCDKYNPSEPMPYPIMGNAWNTEVYDKYKEEYEGYELYFARDFHPHVPIIELNGFSCCDEDLGGPIINTSGEIVGMFAGDGTKCIGIHVTALKEVLKRHTGRKV